MSELAIVSSGIRAGICPQCYDLLGGMLIEHAEDYGDHGIVERYCDKGKEVH